MTIRDEVTTNLDAQYQSPEMRLWPRYDTPDDLDAIEAVPMHERGLPATPNDALIRSLPARHHPDYRTGKTSTRNAIHDPVHPSSR